MDCLFLQCDQVIEIFKQLNNEQALMEDEEKHSELFFNGRNVNRKLQLLLFVHHF